MDWVGRHRREIIERESLVRGEDINIVAEVGWNCRNGCRDINSIAEVQSNRRTGGRDINPVPEVQWSILVEKRKVSTAAEVAWLSSPVCFRIPEIS
jgi:hypothetical protein